MKNLKDDFIDFICDGNMAATMFVLFIILTLFFNGNTIWSLFILLPIEVIFVYFAKILYSNFKFDSITQKLVVMFVIAILILPSIVHISNYIYSDVFHLKTHIPIQDPDRIDGVPSRFQ